MVLLQKQSNKNSPKQKGVTAARPEIGRYNNGTSRTTVIAQHRRVVESTVVGKSDVKARMEGMESAKPKERADATSSAEVEVSPAASPRASSNREEGQAHANAHANAHNPQPLPASPTTRKKRGLRLLFRREHPESSLPPSSPATPATATSNPTTTTTTNTSNPTTRRRSSSLAAGTFSSTNNTSNPAARRRSSSLAAGTFSSSPSQSACPTGGGCSGGIGHILQHNRAQRQQQQHDKREAVRQERRIQFMKDDIRLSPQATAVKEEQQRTSVAAVSPLSAAATPTKKKEPTTKRPRGSSTNFATTTVSSSFKQRTKEPPSPVASPTAARKSLSSYPTKAKRHPSVTATITAATPAPTPTAAGAVSTTPLVAATPRRRMVSPFSIVPPSPTTTNNKPSQKKKNRVVPITPRTNQIHLPTFSSSSRRIVQQHIPSLVVTPSPTAKKKKKINRMVRATGNDNVMSPPNTSYLQAPAIMMAVNVTDGDHQQHIVPSLLVVTPSPTTKKKRTATTAATLTATRISTASATLEAKKTTQDDEELDEKIPIQKSSIFRSTRKKERSLSPATRQPIKPPRSDSHSHDRPRSLENEERSEANSNDRSSSSEIPPVGPASASTTGAEKTKQLPVTAIPTKSATNTRIKRKSPASDKQVSSNNQGGTSPFLELRKAARSTPKGDNWAGVYAYFCVQEDISETGSLQSRPDSSSSLDDDETAPSSSSWITTTTASQEFLILPAMTGELNDPASVYVTLASFEEDDTLPLKYKTPSKSASDLSSEGGGSQSSTNPYKTFAVKAQPDDEFWSRSSIRSTAKPTSDDMSTMELIHHASNLIRVHYSTLALQRWWSRILETRQQQPQLLVGVVQEAGEAIRHEAASFLQQWWWLQCGAKRKLSKTPHEEPESGVEYNVGDLNQIGAAMTLQRWWLWTLTLRKRRQLIDAALVLQRWWLRASTLKNRRWLRDADIDDPYVFVAASPGVRHESPLVTPVPLSSKRKHGDMATRATLEQEALDTKIELKLKKVKLSWDQLNSHRGGAFRNQKVAFLSAVEDLSRHQEQSIRLWKARCWHSEKIVAAQVLQEWWRGARALPFHDGLAMGLDSSSILKLQAWWRMVVVLHNYDHFCLVANLLPGRTRTCMLSKIRGPNLWGSRARLRLKSKRKS